MPRSADVLALLQRLPAAHVVLGAGGPSGATALTAFVPLGHRYKMHAGAPTTRFARCSTSPRPWVVLRDHREVEVPTVRSSPGPAARATRREDPHGELVEDGESYYDAAHKWQTGSVADAGCSIMLCPTAA